WRLSSESAPRRQPASLRPPAYGRHYLPRRDVGNRPRARARAREGMWSRNCGLVSGKLFVPKGPSDSSLAVYCQEMHENGTRPVGNGMVGSEGTYLNLEW